MASTESDFAAVSVDDLQRGINAGDELIKTVADADFTPGSPVGTRILDAARMHQFELLDGELGDLADLLGISMPLSQPLDGPGRAIGCTGLKCSEPRDFGVYIFQRDFNAWSSSVSSLRSKLDARLQRIGRRPEPDGQDKPPNAGARNAKAKRGRQPAQGETNGSRRKRYKSKKEVHFLVIRVLILHHKYSDGEVTNMDPLGVREIVGILKNSRVGKNPISKWFTEHFEGHTRYKQACAQDVLGHFLRRIAQGDETL
jgi:hypothetical protein